jgi:D-alanyl-D-alanine carboxypeptidase/D-alanyl-D-alanine-endopeptidase (penicillin-binding protein 4)
MRRAVALFLGGLLLYSCASAPRSMIKGHLHSMEQSFQEFTGFMLYDPEKKKVLFEHNASRYFTPASNTKIFTLFAGLNLLGDSIPALRYSILGDSLIFTGTCDPSFLYKPVCDSDVYEFLSRSPYELFYTEANWNTAPFGPGWSWEDYDFYYSPMRSPFPIYGNTFEAVYLNGKLTTKPSYFEKFVVPSGDTAETSSLIRSPYSNEVRFTPGRNDRIRNWTKPFITDASMVVQLLSDTLNRPVTFVQQTPATTWQTIYSVPADSLYKVMMQDSDNFIAEQLLLLCAGALGDTLDPQVAIDYVKDNFLKDLPDEPQWNDGSGLSRYNLVTPRSVVILWEKLLGSVDRERLFSLLATGGVSGTIKNYYVAEKPYVYGKTGTLSHVHCLSGYIVTKRGRTLIFSLMNTNYSVPTRRVRESMERLLEMIRDRY